MTIVLCNMLSKLKNASSIKKHKIIISYNKNILTFSKLFYSEGLILSFLSNKQNKNIIIFLHHVSGIFSSFQNLKLISKVSNIQKLKYLDICRLSTQQRLFVFSTSLGILNVSDCKKNHVGGNLLFVC